MKIGYLFLFWLARFVFILLFRGRAFGRHNLPRTGGALLCCNHQSYLDPVIVGLCVNREVHYMARDTLFRGPRVSRFLEYLNAVPVKRGAADLSAIKESIRRLKAGHPLVVFPEGTRTRDGEVGAMHGGVILLARRARVPIIPTVLLGLYECWPRGQALPRILPVVVAFGTPVLAEHIEHLSDEECIAMVRERVVQLKRGFGRSATIGSDRDATPALIQPAA